MPVSMDEDFAEGWGLWISQTFNLTPVFLCACGFAKKLLDTKRHMCGLEIAKVFKKNL